MHRAAYLFLLSTMLLWGGNSVAGKLAVGHVSPMTLVFLRWVLAVLIMLPVGWRAFREDWPELRRHWRLIAGLGACGFTIFNVIFYTALNH
ncbi:MAG: DMT family transporter, partial [Mesorhizobium sp.]